MIKFFENPKVKQRNLFLFAFIFWYIAEIVFCTNLKNMQGIPIETIDKITNYLVLILLLVQMAFFQTYSKKEFILIAGISVPFLIAALVSKNFKILSGWMFIIAAKNADFEKTIKIVYKVLCVAIPLVAVLSLTGVLGDHTMVRDGVARYSLGFDHPNQLGLRLFQFIVCHCYVHRNKLKIIDYGMAGAIALFVYLVPNSQTAYISILVLIALLLAYRGCQQYAAQILNCCGKIMLISAAMINVLSVFLSFIDVKLNPVLRKMDSWMSLRFSQGHKTLQVYGISLWGQKVYEFEEERAKMGMAGGGRLYLDNAYMSLLIRNGAVSYFILSIAYLLLMNYFRKKRQYLIVIILLVYALYGIMEKYTFFVGYNIFLIAFADMMYEKLGGHRNVV